MSDCTLALYGMASLNYLNKTSHKDSHHTYTLTLKYFACRCMSICFIIGIGSTISTQNRIASKAQSIVMLFNATKPALRIHDILMVWVDLNRVHGIILRIDNPDAWGLKTLHSKSRVLRIRDIPIPRTIKWAKTGYIVALVCTFG